MSVFNGNKIITDGLVLHLDASYPQSYDGNNLLWEDLSGNGNNAILVNNISYSGLSGGTMVFDGTDDYISCSPNINSIIKGGSFSFSICFWCYCDENGTRDVFFGDYGVDSTSTCFNIERNSGSVTSNSLRFYWSGNPDYMEYLLTIPQNTWTYVCISYNGTSILFYKNSILVNTYNIVLSSYIKTSGNYYIGRDSRTGTTSLNGNISIFKLYNKSLSQLEVTQNFNSNRSRFGI